MKAVIELVVEMLESPVFLELVGLVVAFIWALPRVQAWRKARMEGREARLFDFAVQAALSTYRAYVERLKLESEDGKLTLTERRQARRYARGALQDMLVEQAPDLLRHYGERALDEVLEEAVGYLKSLDE
ncbi:MAG: hypothetical protein PVH68_14680 [Armatimonadota bacterium]|jgi:hypothetical protein